MVSFPSAVPIALIFRIEPDQYCHLGILVYALGLSDGQLLLRVVDSDYVNLTSLISISRPLISPPDALNIIASCPNTHVIPPSISAYHAAAAAAANSTPSTFTASISQALAVALTGTWVPLEDARELCTKEILNIPTTVGEYFLDRSLGETHFPPAFAEFVKARRHLRELGITASLATTASAGLVGSSIGVGVASGRMTANPDVGAIAELAGLARSMNANSLAYQQAQAHAHAQAQARAQQAMLASSQTSQPLSTPAPAPSVPRTPLPTVLSQAIQAQAQAQAQSLAQRPLSPAPSTVSRTESEDQITSDQRALSAKMAAVRAAGLKGPKVLASPPATPPPSIPDTDAKKPRGRPRKHPLPTAARQAAAASPRSVSTRSTRASARATRTVSGSDADAIDV